MRFWATNTGNKFHCTFGSAKGITANAGATGSRSWSVQEFRYGFNNQEQETELGVTIKNCMNFLKKNPTHSTSEYSFETTEGSSRMPLVIVKSNYKQYRIHNTSLGRFLSVDPLAAEYPWNSTYTFAENLVIWGIDLEGREASKTENGISICAGDQQTYVVQKVVYLWSIAQRNSLSLYFLILWNKCYQEAVREIAAPIEVINNNADKGVNWQNYVDSQNVNLPPGDFINLTPTPESQILRARFLLNPTQVIGGLE